MRVKDIMVQNVITAKGTDTLKQVMNQMVDNRVGGLPIVDDKGKLVGVISDGDILRLIRPKDPISYSFMEWVLYFGTQESLTLLDELKDTPVSHLAKKHGIAKVLATDDLDRAFKLLGTHHFKKLPVVNAENRVVGIVSRGDVIRYVQQSLLSQLER